MSQTLERPTVEVECANCHAKNRIPAAASGVPNQSAIFVGYDIESDEERNRRQNLRLDVAHPSPPATSPSRARRWKRGRSGRVLPHPDLPRSRGGPGTRP